MISCLGLCIVFGLTTTNCSVSNDIEQSPTPEQPKVAKYHNPIVSTSLPDPTGTKADDGYFYLYATENIRNLPIYRSKDLVNWNYVGTAFTDSSRPQWNPNGSIWAPDINVVNGRYMLYYSKSEWGGEWTCGIGIASATSPQGPFIDHGALFISQDIGIQNCIDPFYIEDHGKKYLFWGSFHGIFGAELTEDGLALKPGTKPVQVAGNQMEATYIHKHGDYYYLFGSAVRFRASPKQPQSLTGLAITIHAVMNVITAITNSKTLEVSLLLMANNKNIPMENSKVERPMEAVSVSQSGMTPPNPRACR